MNPARVGLVIGQLHRGGAEKQLTALALGLARDHPVEPVVYCLSRVVDPYGPLLTGRGVELVTFSLAGARKLTRAFSLARALARDRIDLVHAFLCSPTLHVALADLSRRRPWIASYRTARLIRSPLQRRIDAWAHNRADLVTVNARSGAAFIEDYYRIPGEKIRYIPNGVEPPREGTVERSAARRRLGLAERAPVILGVGRLSPEKRLPLFCDVVEELLAGEPDGRCLIAGDGPEMTWLTRRVDGGGLRGRVRLLGASDEVPLLLAASDLLLLTSSFEGTPNTVLEAMSAGLPVVATDVGDVAELLGAGEAGHVLPAGDRAGLVRACRKLLADPLAARELGRRGRRRVESRYSMERMVTAYARLYAALAPPSGSAADSG